MIILATPGRHPPVREAALWHDWNAAAGLILTLIPAIIILYSILTSMIIGGMMSETGWRIILYVIGWALSIAWPFLLVAVTEGAKFDWRKVSGRLIVGAIGLVTFLAGDNAIGQLGAMSYLAAFVAGFGASSVGNNVRRTVDARRA